TFLHDARPIYYGEKRNRREIFERMAIFYMTLFKRYLQYYFCSLLFGRLNDQFSPAIARSFLLTEKSYTAFDFLHVETFASIFNHDANVIIYFPYSHIRFFCFIIFLNVR